MRPVGLVAVLTLAVLPGCGTAEAGRPTVQAPTTFTVHGRLTLRHAGSGSLGDGRCVGDASKGFMDIAAGTRVTVLNATSRRVAAGRLGGGRGHRSTCTFPFTVRGVPATGTMYFLRVGTRPHKVGFARVDAGLVTVTMGVRP